jgi:hypothetical protein
MAQLQYNQSGARRQSAGRPGRRHGHVLSEGGRPRARSPGSSSPWEKGVKRRCERRGAGCKEARRGRCRGASERSADAADGSAPPQALGAAGLLLAATRGEKRAVDEVLIAARCKRPAATPVSIFPRAARIWTSDRSFSPQPVAGGAPRRGAEGGLSRTGGR